jgi:hypothetical protein
MIEKSSLNWKKSGIEFCIILTRKHLNRLRTGSDLTQRKPTCSK